MITSCLVFRTFKSGWHNDLGTSYFVMATRQNNKNMHARKSIRWSLLVEDAICVLMPHGKATCGRVAEKIGLSLRTLQRRLKSEATTFESILKRVRLKTIDQLLCQPDLPISDIARRVGFKSTCAFSSAIRGEYEMSPRQRRHLLLKQQQNNLHRHARATILIEQRNRI